MQSLQQMANWRGNVARISIVLSPLIALAMMMQVFGYVIFALDLYASVGPSVAMTLFAAALVIVIVLYSRWRALGSRFAQRLSNIFAFDSRKRTQQLLGELELTASGHSQAL